MLPTDMALIQDPKFRPWVEKYAQDRDLCVAHRPCQARADRRSFFDHFGKAFYKLTELGVDRGASKHAVVPHSSA